MHTAGGTCRVDVLWYIAKATSFSSSHLNTSAGTVLIATLLFFYLHFTFLSSKTHLLSPEKHISLDGLLIGKSATINEPTDAIVLLQ